MSKMRKLLAILLTFAMVLGMSMTTFAADKVGTSNDTGVIEVKGITPESDISVKAYKIIDAVYDSNDNFSGYELVYENSEINMAVVDAWKNVLITEDNLNNIIAEGLKKADETKGSHTYKRMYELVNDGEYYRATVQVGTYLVMIENAEEAIYSPVVISVNYINKNGENIIYNGAVNVEEIYSVASGDAWVKKAEHPNFTKTEADANGDTCHDGLYGNSINVGSEVNYTLTIDPIPYYGGSHPVFNVVDTLDDGLTYKDGSLKVTVDGNDFEDYELTVDGQEITVDFASDKNYTLNDNQGGKVVITYTATLDTDATFNNEANVNTAVLTYTKDSKVENENKEATIEEKTYTYTFNVTNNLVKVDENGEALAGAKFEIYTKDENGTKVPYTNTVLTFVKDNKNNDTIETNESGQLVIKGLEEGTYYLQETQAPAGYSVNTHEYEIIIEAEYASAETVGKDEGELVAYKVTVDGTEVGTGENAFEIPNTKLISLPSTGGIGTTMFTIGGCAIMIAAAYLFFTSRKREEA